MSTRFEADGLPAVQRGVIDRQVFVAGGGLCGELHRSGDVEPAQDIVLFGEESLEEELSYLARFGDFHNSLDWGVDVDFGHADLARCPRHPHFVGDEGDRRLLLHPPFDGVGVLAAGDVDTHTHGRGWLEVESIDCAGAFELDPRVVLARARVPGGGGVCVDRRVGRVLRLRGEVRGIAFRRRHPHPSYLRHRNERACRAVIVGGVVNVDSLPFCEWPGDRVDGAEIASNELWGVGDDLPIGLELESALRHEA